MKRLLIFVAIALLVLGMAGTAMADGQQRENPEDREASGLATPAAAPANPPGDECKSSADCNKGQVCCGSDTDKAGMCLGDENACNTSGPNTKCGNDRHCDDENPCTIDLCVINTCPGHCVNYPAPMGRLCPDGRCDGSGNCLSRPLGCGYGTADCNGDGFCDCMGTCNDGTCSPCSEGTDDCNGDGTCDCVGICDQGICYTQKYCSEIGYTCDPTVNNCCYGRCEYQPPGAYWCIGECWPNYGACYVNDVCCSGCCYNGSCMPSNFCR